MPASPRLVFKFGGTSVGSPGTFGNVVDVINREAEDGPVVAVVSALSNVTRQLSAGLEAFTTSPDTRDAVADELEADLRSRHREHAAAVLTEASRAAFEAILDDRMRTLRQALAEVRETGFQPAARDAVLAVGEQLSVPLVTLALRDRGRTAPHCDATRLVVTDDTYGEANVHGEATRERVQAWYAALDEGAVPVVAGFIGATKSGRTTTLGFEGSDYSAALFAQLLSAGALRRFTDVDGLYTDDPRISDAAERLEEISMETAYAMTESGRLGMHPKTLRPLVEARIPMEVRSIHTPDTPGTRIVPAD